MKEFIKYLIQCPGKLLFPVVAAIGLFLICQFFVKDPGDNPPWVVGSVLALISLINLACWLQVWREWKQK